MFEHKFPHDRLVIVDDQEIYINAHLFISKDYCVTGKELLLDVFSTQYKSQKIQIEIFDGENYKFSGFLEFIKCLAQMFNIPKEQITWQTHDPSASVLGNHCYKNLVIFQSAPKSFSDIAIDFLEKSKFVGVSLGRFNQTRFRLIYEIDRAFPNNNFMIFQPKKEKVLQELHRVSDIYKNELDWFSNKIFDQDIQSLGYFGTVNWAESYNNYSNIYNQYQIEIVSETDAMSDYWFTEKTARCLAVGKPFVLVSGTGSLTRLRDMGFNTFNEVIDESYDSAPTPTSRINQIITSLQSLYINPNKIDLIKKMYRIAEKNKEIYFKKWSILN